MTAYIISSTIIAMIATAGMSSFLWIITGLKLSNVDMVKAIGSLYTRKEETSFFPGLMMHFTAGIIFCNLYILLFKVFPATVATPFIYVVLGISAGFVHGIVVSLLLVILVAEHHPLNKYRNVGFSVAVYHFLAHIIYGFIIGFMYYLISGGVSV